MTRVGLIAGIVLCAALPALPAGRQGGRSALAGAEILPQRPQSVSATPFEQRDVVVDGMRLRYIDEGRGPALLILSGLTSRIEEFDTMTGILRGRFRVLVVDLPGTGYSDKPDRPYSLQFYEDTIVHFLDSLGVRQCYVAGGSLGGNLTLRLAHRDQDRFPRVVAWAPASSWKAKPWIARLGRAFGGRLLFWPTVKIQSRYWYSPDFPGRDKALRDTFAYYREIMSPGFLRMYWDLATEQMGSSLQDIAADIRTPTLLVWGDKDDGGGMAGGVARLHELMPDNRLTVFPGARHSLAVERPKELSEAIEAFLAPPAEADRK
jgi:pimeloyl-ACP methyl ester carboxylesterase